MKQSLLVAALLALALSACGKKEEAAAIPVAPATVPAAVPASTSAPAAEPMSAPTSATGSADTGGGIKLDNLQVPAAPATEQK